MDLPYALSMILAAKHHKRNRKPPPPDPDQEKIDAWNAARAKQKAKRKKGKRCDQ